MTSTDLAFIAAYQQSTVPLPLAGVETTTTAPASGPHFLWKNSAEGANRPLGEKTPRAKSTRRAPLSKLIAERHQRQAASSAVSATPPVLELNAFNWPDTPTRLAREYGSALIASLASIRGSIATLVGASSGVGLTTMAIALAQATARADLRVALVDANPVASDLAFQCGVRRLRTLAEAAEQGDMLENCIVGCRDNLISLVIAGGPIAPEAARKTLDQLVATNDLVIIDAGAMKMPLSPWITASEGVCLVDDQPEPSRDDLLRSLAMSGIKVHGVLENFVSA